MENTCSQKCKYWKKYKDSCPFFLTTAWVDDKGKQSIANDCAPKRAVIIQMDNHNLLVGMQKAAEQERNQMHMVLETIASMINAKRIK